MISLRRMLVPLACVALALVLGVGVGACRMEQKSDDAITRSVTSRIQLDTRLAPFELTAASQGGVVTLMGTVETVSQRDQAEMLARATDGVHDVHNRIEVGGASALAEPGVGAPPPREPGNSGGSDANGE